MINKKNFINFENNIINTTYIVYITKVNRLNGTFGGCEIGGYGIKVQTKNDAIYKWYEHEGERDANYAMLSSKLI